MCQRFIEGFTNRVIEKAICCDFCLDKNKKCLIPNSFNYLPKDIYSYIIGHDEVKTYFFSEETCKDIVLSSLHDNIYYFLKYLSSSDNIYPFQIGEHLNCIKDEQLIYTDTDWSPSKVFRFYCQNYLHGDVERKLEELVEEEQIKFKQMKFKDWLLDLIK